MRFGLLFAFLFLFKLGFSQNLMDDLKELSAKLESSSAVYIEANCKVYTKFGGSLTNEVISVLKVKGSNSVSIIDNVQVYQSNSLQVIVDKNNRGLTVISKKKLQSNVEQPSKKVIKDITKFLNENTSSSKCDIVLKSEVAGVRTYSVTDDGDLEELVIKIDVVEKKLKFVSYKFKEQANVEDKYIEINYDQFTYNSSEASVIESDYIIVSNGKYLAGNKFKGYRVNTYL